MFVEPLWVEACIRQQRRALVMSCCPLVAACAPLVLCSLFPECTQAWSVFPGTGVHHPVPTPESAERLQQDARIYRRHDACPPH